MMFDIRGYGSNLLSKCTSVHIVQSFTQEVKKSNFVHVSRNFKGEWRSSEVQNVLNIVHVHGRGRGSENRGVLKTLLYSGDESFLCVSGRGELSNLRIACDFVLYNPLILFVQGE